MYLCVYVSLICELCANVCVGGCVCVCVYVIGVSLCGRGEVGSGELLCMCVSFSLSVCVCACVPHKCSAMLRVWTRMIVAPDLCVAGSGGGEKLCICMCLCVCVPPSTTYIGTTASCVVCMSV